MRGMLMELLVVQLAILMDLRMNAIALNLTLMITMLGLVSILFMTTRMSLVPMIPLSPPLLLLLVAQSTNRAVMLRMMLIIRSSPAWVSPIIHALYRPSLPFPRLCEGSSHSGAEARSKTSLW